jgi:hypothetical protein
MNIPFIAYTVDCRMAYVSKIFLCLQAMYSLQMIDVTATWPTVISQV